MTAKTRHLAGALLAAGCLATACTTTTPPATAPTTVAPSTTVVGGSRPAETAGATLRAQMTGLLQSHVYLVGLATSVVVNGGDPAPAVAAIDANSHDLADLVTAAYDASTGARFLTVWSSQVPAFIAYARAKAASDDAGVTAAKAQLTGFDTSLATMIAATNVYTVATGTNGLETEFQGYLTALQTAIDDQAAKSPKQYGDLATAADANMPHTADVLAAAFAKAYPHVYPGTVTGSAANLRATLTAALVSHAYQLGITTATLIGGGDPAPPSAALTLNTSAVTNAFSAAYGDAEARRINELLTSQVDAVIAYAKGAASGDAAGQSKARADLDQNATDLVKAVTSLCPRVEPSQLSAAVTGEVQDLVAVVDAQAARSPGQFDALRSAAGGMPALADAVSEGIALQFPLKYLA